MTIDRNGTKSKRDYSYTSDIISVMLVEGKITDLVSKVTRNIQ